MTDYAVAGWCAALDIEGASPNTIRAYRAGVTDLAAALPDALLEASRTDIRQWLSRRKADGLAPATLRLHLKAVKLFYKWLVAEGDILASPAEGIKEPPVEIPVTRTLDAGQIRDLLAGCKGNNFIERRDTAIILLMLDTGLRLAECAGLRVDDVDLDSGQVVVRGKGANRRGPRVRMAPFGACTGRALARYLRVRGVWAGQHDALWANSRGRRAGQRCPGVARLSDQRRHWQAALEVGAAGHHRPGGTSCLVDRPSP